MPSESIGINKLQNLYLFRIDIWITNLDTVWKGINVVDKKADGKKKK